MPGRDADQCCRRWTEVLDPSFGKGPWTSEEEETLAQLNEDLGDEWAEIRKHIPGLTESQCRNFWMWKLGAACTTQGNLENGEDGLQARQLERSSPATARVRMAWTRTEDETLMRLVRETGSTRNWKNIAHGLPGRSGNQCRSHWNYSLDPSINKGPWSPEEERKIAQLHEKFGNSWAKISKQIPGRTDLQCRNFCIGKADAARVTQNVSVPAEGGIQALVDGLSSPTNRIGPASWVQAEDETLLRQVQEAGPIVNWVKIAESLPGRNARECRIHWTENLTHLSRWAHGALQMTGKPHSCRKRSVTRGERSASECRAARNGSIETSC